MTDKQGPDKTDNPRIHEDLKGFNIQIDEFGQVRSTMSQEELNAFLNENVEDKKFSAKVKKQLDKLYDEYLEEE